jgi:hypothetical protein
VFLACFGLLQFVLVSFGMTKTLNPPVSTKKQNNLNKSFVSDSAIASLRSCFSCFESTLISTDTLSADDIIQELPAVSRINIFKLF